MNFTKKNCVINHCHLKILCCVHTFLYRLCQYVLQHKAFELFEVLSHCKTVWKVARQTSNSYSYFLFQHQRERECLKELMEKEVRF